VALNFTSLPSFYASLCAVLSILSMDIFTPNYVQLFNACYPASSALVAAPELSRLTYYALVPQNLLPPPVSLRTADIIIAAN